LAICDYLFIGGKKSYAGLASTKGIALTVGIAAAIIGSSFLIWYIPANSGILDAPRTDSEIIGDVYARHNDLATDIDSRFDQWKDDDPAAGNMAAEIESARSQIGEMRQHLDNRQPAQEWQESYDIYVEALDAYAAYLGALEQKVDDGDRTDPDPALAQEWKGLVDDSVNAMPINS
jgi:hypothetical protein